MEAVGPVGEGRAHPEGGALRSGQRLRGGGGLRRLRGEEEEEEAGGGGEEEEQGGGGGLRGSMIGVIASLHLQINFLTMLLLEEIREETII